MMSKVTSPGAYLRQQDRLTCGKIFRTLGTCALITTHHLVLAAIHMPEFGNLPFLLHLFHLFLRSLDRLFFCFACLVSIRVLAHLVDDRLRGGVKDCIGIAEEASTVKVFLRVGPRPRFQP
ncbi:hypothetical protein RvY_02174 [Ramazzottius varieornatus]|uniref:Uncharacterized protein n=1 Tax=Ramazzottius varieornatus TaxID=947166 RepID=A0A1D1UIW4_RAMVA|nr:hypothetical protein RvY_02174 [Ramazzottius varieornatus]